jgi:hypothetical protein
MNKLVRIAFLVAAIAGAAVANAETGTFSIVAGGAVGSAGYCSTVLCSPQVGSITGATLSDGKVVIEFYNGLYSSGGNYDVDLIINGFTSNPGVSYFKTLTVKTCNVAPDSFSTAAVTQYYYDASSGYAWWKWVRSVAGACFTPGTSYTGSIQ